MMYLSIIIFMYKPYSIKDNILVSHETMSSQEK